LQFDHWLLPAHRIGALCLGADGCAGFTPAEASWFAAQLHRLLHITSLVPRRAEKQKGQPARFADCPLM